MTDTNVIEREQQRDYPGLTVRRERGAVVVHVPVRYHGRNGRQMLLTPEDHEWKPERTANQTLVEAIVEAILRGEEPEGISLRRLQKGLPVGCREQRERWYQRG